MPCTPPRTPGRRVRCIPEPARHLLHRARWFFRRMSRSRKPGFRGSLLGMLAAGILLAGCGAEDGASDRAPSTVDRLLAEAEAGGDQAGPPADFTQPRVSGWVVLQPACDFPLRLQAPQGWDVDETQTRSTHLTLRREGVPTVGVQISMMGGHTAVEDRMREAEAHDTSVVRLAEVSYGARTMPVHGGGNRESVMAYPAVADWGAAVQHAVVRLNAIWDRDGTPLVEEETLARIAATLEPNDC